MQAEVIALGDELTSGSRLDTNSQWLSQQLEALGITVVFHTTVGDDLAAATAVLQTASQRVHVVVTTGGLGPTADDLTRQALAQATGRPLVRNEEALRHIRELFARRRRDMPDQNAVQADFPKGSDVIPNPHGTAPGIRMTIDGGAGAMCHLFLLPGVPAEMREMWRDSVAPTLIELLGTRRRYIHNRSIHCFGAGESAVESMLPDLIRRGRQPRVGITASQATITLRLTAESDSLARCQQMIAVTEKQIRDTLGDLVFGEDEDQLPDVVVRRLAARQHSVAVAECGTGGLIATWLSAAAPEQPCFGGGMVMNDGRARQPNGLPDIQQKPDHGDRTTGYVTTMAQFVKQHFGCDYGLAVGPFPRLAATAETGSPRAGGPSRSATAATESVLIVVVGPGGVTERVVPFGGHPAIVRARFAKEALNLLRLQLP